MAVLPYDAIFFDFYGTLSAGDRNAVLAACRKVLDTFPLPLSVEELAVSWGERFFSVVDRSNHADFRTLYECEKQSLADTIGRWVGAFDPTPFVAELEHYWRHAPIHEDVLDTLAQIDLPRCVISNADSEPLHAAILRHGLRFDAVICSESSRCYKPEAAIFERAVKALGVDPHRCLHVGDSLHSDVGGAAKLGITTVWINRDARIHDIGTARPDRTITSLTHLLDWGA